MVPPLASPDTSTTLLAQLQEGNVPVQAAAVVVLVDHLSYHVKFLDGVRQVLLAMCIQHDRHMHHFTCRNKFPYLLRILKIIRIVVPHSDNKGTDWATINTVCCCHHQVLCQDGPMAKQLSLRLKRKIKFCLCCIMQR